jgi:trehalose/maltose hydrolase-like predicted phosphorylase
MDDRESTTFEPQPASPPAPESGEAVSVSRSLRSFPGIAALAEVARDPNWVLVEPGFTLAREHEIESLFAIGNGYVGNRGSLAEGSPLSAPATFVAGVFESDPRPGTVPGLFVLPDWTSVRAWVEGQPLSMLEGEILSHRRVLDFRRGILWREWRHRDPNGRIHRLTTFRLASLADRHLLAQSIILVAENYSGRVQTEASIELPEGVLASPPPEEYRARRAANRPNVLPLALKSPGTGITVAFAMASQLISAADGAGRREMQISERRITERFEVDVEIGAEYRLDRLLSVYTSRDVKQPDEAADTHIHEAFPHGINSAVAAHVGAWETRWRSSDAELEGDDSLQRALRFSAYHLISAANPEDPRVSVGARALTGESYKGHVFWDTEIYMVPYYTFTHPPSARALLMYRHHTLPAARRKAQAAGYRGAMYPWESADTGDETTPKFVIDPAGQVIQVLNGEMEIHITADIAYSIWQYWQATEDDSFFLDAGAEVLLETARFWASRGRVEEDGLYHIRGVIGPDEYHDNVDDNAYTNLMAAWNLRTAGAAAGILQQGWPERWQRLSSELAIAPEEPASWRRLADITFTGFDPRTHLYEQFRGYYEREQVDLASYEPRNAAMDVILGHEKIQHTNVVKQADVVMAVCLLWDDFPAEVRAANFRYYEPRTGHGSSLSPSIHALVAARLGNLSLAEKYLRQAAEIDLGNNMGNAAGGVHAAAIGGLWQAIAFGFAGVRIHPHGLMLSPHLLPHWRRLSFPVQFRGRQLRLSITQRDLQLHFEEGTEPVSVTVEGGAAISAAPHRQYVIECNDGAWLGWHEMQK